MPPQRTRNPQDDSKSEAANAKEKGTTGFTANSTGKGRRNGVAAAAAVPASAAAAKEALNAAAAAAAASQSAATTTTGQASSGEDPPRIDWSAFEASVLLAYKSTHQLDVPSAFTSAYNERMLSRPGGIGQLSPTMARHKAHQRMSKDRLATIVRKDFNGAMVSEADIISSFLYAVHNQGKAFRMRFEPTQPR